LCVHITVERGDPFTRKWHRFFDDVQDVDLRRRRGSGFGFGCRACGQRHRRHCRCDHDWDSL